MKVEAFGTVLQGPKLAVVESLWWFLRAQDEIGEIFFDQEVKGSVLVITNKLSVENAARIGVHADAYAIFSVQHGPSDWELKWVALLDNETGVYFVGDPRDN